MSGTNASALWQASTFNDGRSVERVVIINDLSVPRGGATSVALASARLLSERGVPVTFLAGDDASAADRNRLPVDFVAAGGTHVLDGPRLTAAVRGLYNAAAERFVARWIEENDTAGTVYHLHGWSKILSPAIFRALRPVAIRLVISAHDFFLVCPNGGYFDFQREEPCGLRPMSFSCLVSNCDRRNFGHKIWRSVRQSIRRAIVDLGTGPGIVLVVHDGMIGHLEHGGIARHRLRTLRNPVLPWRSERVPAEGNRTFLFIGRLEEDKGVDLLARAARRGGVPLRIVGHGPLGERLATDFPEIEQVGWKSHAEIAELIGDARALVMPTRCRETFGLAAVEALMSGLPILISDHAMLAGEVVAAGFGLSCDPHDEGELAAKLQHLARDDALIASMSRRAHAEARRLAPTPDEWADDLLAVYTETLQRAVGTGAAVNRGTLR